MNVIKSRTRNGTGIGFILQFGIGIAGFNISMLAIPKIEWQPLVHSFGEVLIFQFTIGSLGKQSGQHFYQIGLFPAFVRRIVSQAVKCGQKMGQLDLLVLICARYLKAGLRSRLHNMPRRPTGKKHSVWTT
jgi:hypothetical protein